MEKWTGSLAVVTGSTAGIGAAIAEKLIQFGINVVGIGRRLNLLEELQEKLTTDDAKFHPVKCDLTDEEQILSTFQWIEDTLGPISILVNNAGLLFPTTLTEGETELWKATVDVNVISACICTREAIKSMKKHEIDGVIINISSVTARKVPDMLTSKLFINIYSATKYALNAYSESLRFELRQEKSKIKVNTISPGLTASDMYRDFPKDETDRLAGVYPVLASEHVAEAAVYILSVGPNIQVQEIILRPLGEYL